MTCGHIIYYQHRPENCLTFIRDWLRRKSNAGVETPESSVTTYFDVKSHEGQGAGKLRGDVVFFIVGELPGAVLGRACNPSRR
jgi:hypothetical protein